MRRRLPLALAARRIRMTPGTARVQLRLSRAGARRRAARGRLRLRAVATAAAPDGRVARASRLVSPVRRG